MFGGSRAYPARGSGATAWAAVSGWLRLLRHIWGPGLDGGKSPEGAGGSRGKTPEPAKVGSGPAACQLGASLLSTFGKQTQGS